MKALTKNKDLCTGCHICENECSNTFFKTADPQKAALRIKEFGKPEFKIITCTQCGKCITVCPVEAISRSKLGTVVIDKAKCIGCLSCIGFCPEEAMFQHDNDTLPFKCIACGKCVKACPNKVLSLTEGKI